MIAASIFSTLPGAMFWGWCLWYVFYRPFHKRMPWADKSIKIKTRDKEWK